MHRFLCEVLSRLIFLLSIVYGRCCFSKTKIGSSSEALESSDYRRMPVRLAVSEFKSLCIAYCSFLSEVSKAETPKLIRRVLCIKKISRQSSDLKRQIAVAQTLIQCAKRQWL